MRRRGRRGRAVLGSGRGLLDLQEEDDGGQRQGPQNSHHRRARVKAARLYSLYTLGAVSDSVE